MATFVQGLRGTARGLPSHGHPRHDPLDAPPPRSPKPKAPANLLTFKTGSKYFPCSSLVISCCLPGQCGAAFFRYRIRKFLFHDTPHRAAPVARYTLFNFIDAMNRPRRSRAVEEFVQIRQPLQ